MPSRRQRMKAWRSRSGHDRRGIRRIGRGSLRRRRACSERRRRRGGIARRRRFLVAGDLRPLRGRAAIGVWSWGKGRVQRRHSIRRLGVLPSPAEQASRSHAPQRSGAASHGCVRLCDSASYCALGLAPCLRRREACRVTRRLEAELRGFLGARPLSTPGPRIRYALIESPENDS